MRVKYSMLNVTAGLGNQLIITGLSFISRTVFISTLGVEYLGISALFTNILLMLTLAEAGIGASIVYSLYKPVAEKDQEKINVLMKLYKKAYLVIAIIVLSLGLLIYPFLGYIVKDSSVTNIDLIYIIFLINTVLPYLYLHKNSFLSVCQKNYIVTGLYSISQIVSIGFKIAILYYTQNYILYLIIDIGVTLLTTLSLAIIVNRMYPFLKDKVTTSLDIETRNTITKNIKAIILQNIGAFIILSSDNILIATFVSVSAVGIYSNYKMLIEICKTFTNQIFSNLYHSVGNLVSKESIEKIHAIYNSMWLLSFWIHSFFSITLLIVLEPFIVLWIGKEFLMSENVVFILLFLFFERGMRNPVTTFKTTSGIFHKDRYVPLCQAALNLMTSIILVQYIGILGVFIGTLISTLVLPFWITPLIVYRKVFKLPVRIYFKKYFYYIGLVTGTYLITDFITDFIETASILELILKVLVCCFIPNLIFTLVFYRTCEFKYLSGLAKSLSGKILIKVRVISIFKTIE